MKKRIMSLLVFSLAALLLAAPASSELRFGFRFLGGLNYLNGGDINLAAKGQVDLYDADYARHSGYSTGNGYKPVHLGLNFGGDLILQLGPRIGIGVGSGVASARRTLNATYIRPSVEDANYTAEMKMSATALKVSLFYFLPLTSGLNLYFYGGPGYYLASMKFHTRLENSVYFDDLDTFDFKGGGMGFHGGFGLEIGLARMVNLLFDVSGQHAAFSNFTGRALWTGPWWTVTQKGDIYFGDAPVLPLGNFPRFIPSQTTPSAPYSNVRKAKIDFTGFSALLGLMFRL